MAPASVLLDSLDARGEVDNVLVELSEPTVGAVRVTWKALLRSACAKPCGPLLMHVDDAGSGRVIARLPGAACSRDSASVSRTPALQAPTDRRVLQKAPLIETFDSVAACVSITVGMNTNDGTRTYTTLES